MKKEVNATALNAKVAIVMGSLSDFEVVKPCMAMLDEFGIEWQARVISAHRSPEEAHSFASSAKARGIEVIIGVAGKAAHLAGVLAAFTPLPVIALPVSTKMMGGLDSLLSMVQMPKGIPVATVAVDGGDNAGILAAQILALKYPEIAQKMDDFKLKMAQKIDSDNQALQQKLAELKK